MSLRIVPPLILCATLPLALSACSAYRVYEKCGFAGCAGDAQTTAQVETTLRNSPGVDAWNIQVQTLDHVVYLYGLVDTGLQRSIIESIARDTPNVTGVVSSIGVRNFAR